MDGDEPLEKLFSDNAVLDVIELIGYAIKWFPPT